MGTEPSGGDGERFDISFERPPDTNGVVVVDPIERHRFRLETPEPIRPTPTGTENFWFPVDVAARIHTERIELPTVISTCVRDTAGTLLAQTDHFAFESFSGGEYSIELCGPVKLYLRVTAPVEISADLSRTTIDFGEPVDVAIGARSHHEQPAGTITTTDDPRDMQVAVSAFSSALKTTSPERAYPTLRGHPPLVELGTELDVPAAMCPPDTGVRLELPPTYEHLYVAAPLAYYLGAEITEGVQPRLVTDNGFQYELAPNYELTVERTLKQVFLLDCLVRTEGLYRINLHERAELEPVLPFELAETYDLPLSDQLATYLPVPWETVATHVPEWKLTTHVAPTSENVELLPFVANDLAIVRTPYSDPVSSSEVQATAAGEFFRHDGGAFTRGTTSAKTARTYVQPETTDSLEQAWMGEGTPIGASKTTPLAFQNRLNRTPAAGDIGITVVCNDHRMTAERDLVDRTYGSREELPFSVETHYNLSVDKLRSVLAKQTEFFHYIGHIDDGGFLCADGRLDVTGLDQVGMDSFLLNACQSYEQGLALVAGGAIGGIVTLADVINEGAVEVGVTLARLLNRGFPLRSALKIASGESVIGNQYTVIGDGGLAIAQADGGVPNICEVTRRGERYELEFITYPTSHRGMGSIVAPMVEHTKTHYLSSGAVDTFEMTKQELVDFLLLENVPVRFENQLYWSGELDFELF